MKRTIALSPKPRTYIPKDFKEEANPPKFCITSMTEFEVDEFQIANKDATMNASMEELQELQIRFQAMPKPIEPKEGEEPGEDQLPSSEIMKLLADMQWCRRKMEAKTLIFNIKVLKSGHLKGWENVPIETEDGEEMLEFSMDNIPYLKRDLIEELTMEIMGMIGEPDQKNLEIPSSVENGIETKQTMEKDGIVQTVEKQTSQENEIVNP